MDIPGAIAAFHLRVGEQAGLEQPGGLLADRSREDLVETTKQQTSLLEVSIPKGILGQGPEGRSLLFGHIQWLQRANAGGGGMLARSWRAD